jgi:ABC-2 type transport system ATP-binding protein
MNKVEELCDRVLMMHKGRMVLYGDVMETRAKFRTNSIRISVDGELGELPGVVERIPRNRAVELVLESGSSSQAILDLLREKGVVINHFEVITPHLRDIFLDKVGVVSE